MEAPKPVMTTATQPQAVQMSVMNPPQRNSTQQEHQQCQKASRLRGGGAGKVRFLISPFM
ncbi:hypothetical protein BDY19DRAFT_953562 [Irpex rosettiformis]|uniref:Uncharacterized protein n=1 Tax=Irpex rosettiformis TaxID=378272 RepID=A0ACB8U0V3_9APHY|nr:hypothetical protein BDY19DRAFT_953562 [Irpex rosettiformis]